MPRLPDSFLEDLKSRLRISDVASKFMALRKAGKEFIAVDDKSLSFSDQKGIFKDFGKTGKTGDIFELVMWRQGCTFETAVEYCASLAGLQMPTGSKAASAQHSSKSEDAHPNAPGNDESRPIQPTGGITHTYDYLDADGTLIYQVCRLEQINSTGRKIKTFLQRRPAPDGLKGWVWGLSSGDFIQRRDGDWVQATDDRREKMPNAPVRSFKDAVAHGLYHLPELMDERAQPESERRAVFITEGEKDANTLADWDALGVTNSGGAKHWLPHLAQMFEGLDVIILIDNDPAGRERGHLIGASLRGIAKTTKVLDWREHWPNCPEKADVTDWRDLNAGTAEKLFAIVGKLPSWSPQRPESNFLAIPFSEIDKPAREFEWLIKKILTRGETSMWYGQPGCGKSFLLTDAALSVARGTDWMGFKARKGLVVYQAGEGGLGLKKRLRAYRQEHGLGDQQLPFVLLPTTINLYMNEEDTDKLIREIKQWQAYYDITLELVVIDTFSAAAPGADENTAKDVGPVLARARRIAVETGAHVAIVHHTPKGGGSPRGWGGFTGNVENVVEVNRTEETTSEFNGSTTTVRGVREFIIRKQKDGEDGFGRKFVLKQLVLGRDADDELVTSCIVSQVEGFAGQGAASTIQLPKGYVDLPNNSRSVMRALASAIQKKGRLPPSNVGAPAGVMCVTVGDWQDERRETLYAGPDPDDPSGSKFRNRIKKQIERTYDSGLWTNKQNLIGKSGEWIWRTERRVFGIDPPPLDNSTVADQAMMLAPGEDPGDMAGLLAQMDGGRWGS